jgi:hypothetical protein
MEILVPDHFIKPIVHSDQVFTFVLCFLIGAKVVVTSVLTFIRCETGLKV